MRATGPNHPHQPVIEIKYLREDYDWSSKELQAKIDRRDSIMADLRGRNEWHRVSTLARQYAEQSRGDRPTCESCRGAGCRVTNTPGEMDGCQISATYGDGTFSSQAPIWLCKCAQAQWPNEYPPSRYAGESAPIYSEVIL